MAGDEETVIEEIVTDAEEETDKDGQPEGEEEGKTPDGEGDPEVLIVSLEEEEPKDAAPQWVKDLRKTNRELQKQLKETERKLAEKAQPATQALGPKPTLADHDFDADAFETALDAWKERKRQADQAEERARTQQEEQNRTWQQKQQAYATAKTALKVKDFAEAEEAVIATLDETQQGIIVHGAADPALLVYAIGKNPAAAKRLAAITDPVQFAFAVARMEATMKTKTKSPPPPETVLASERPPAADSKLERLRQKAATTGDYTELNAYKRTKRLAQ